MRRRPRRSSPLHQRDDRETCRATNERAEDGWEAGIRTPITASRAPCPTVERPPSARSRNPAAQEPLILSGSSDTRKGGRRILGARRAGELRPPRPFAERARALHARIGVNRREARRRLSVL